MFFYTQQVCWVNVVLLSMCEETIRLPWLAKKQNVEPSLLQKPILMLQLYGRIIFFPLENEECCIHHIDSVITRIINLC